MRYIKPIFYDSFSCTADKCPDTCCAGWQIMIDENSLGRYAEEKGDFGQRLRNSIDWQEGAFYQYDRRCAFLNGANLCDLYTALGNDALCDTCRNYPRHVEEYEGLRELSLSLSCPVAAEIILSQQGFPEFLEEEDEATDELEDEFEDFDLLLFTQLEDARKAVFNSLRKVARDDEVQGCISITLQENDQTTLQSIMNMALKLAQKLQDCIEEGNYFELEEVIQKYQNLLDAQGTNTLVCKGSVHRAGIHKSAGIDLYRKYTNLYYIIYRLERLRDEWTIVLEEMYQILYADGRDAYLQIRDEFEDYLQKNPSERKQWENIGLQLFVFFMYTYFCGAVYDDWIYSKMALAVYSVEFIRELYLVVWVKRKSLNFPDYVELAYRYAREIEHSDLNLNALEEIFMKEYEIFWNNLQEIIDNPDKLG